MSLGTSNRDGGKTSESGHLRALAKIVSGDVLEGLAVSQRSAGANMSVDVAVGDAFVRRSDGSYAHPVFNDAVYNQVITAADGSNPRRDLLVLYVDYGQAPSTAVSNNTNGVVKIKMVNGTPAGSPTDPNGAAIQASVGAGNPYTVLARVRVPAGQTSISNSLIDDLRNFATPNMSAAVKNSWLNGGWLDANEAWTFSSYSSTTRLGVFTVPSDATLKYAIGMKVRIAQATGGTKYGRIMSLTSTTLTVLMLNGVTLNNEAVNTPFYSAADAPYAPTPVDFKEPTPWQSLSMTAGWVDYGANYESTQYRKNVAGVVEIKGFIKSGTTSPGTAFATMPVGYRPIGWNYYPAVLSTTAMGSIEIRNTGQVSIVSASATYTSIPHIMYSADA